MRDLHELDIYRLISDDVIRLYGSAGDASNGVFRFEGMLIIASSGHGWDHVSASRKDQIPTWEDMEHVKRMFFKEDETAMQLHVPPAEHINKCSCALHLWRPLGQEIPRPPGWMVG